MNSTRDDDIDLKGEFAGDKDQTITILIAAITVSCVLFLFLVPIVPMIVQSGCGHGIRIESVGYYLWNLGGTFYIGPYCH